MTYEEFLQEQENKQLPFPEIQKKFEKTVMPIDELYSFWSHSEQATEPWTWMETYDKYEKGEVTFGECDSILLERLRELHEFSRECPYYELPKTEENITDEELEKYFSNRKIEFEKSIYYTELWLCRSCYVILRNEKKNKLKPNTKEILLYLVFAEYPQFKKDYEQLKNAYVFIETDIGLNWNYSKQSLAEYFGNQKKDNESIKWQYIEKLFTIKNQEITGLKDSFYQYRNIYQKESKDYENIQKIIDN